MTYCNLCVTTKGRSGTGTGQPALDSKRNSVRLLHYWLSYVMSYTYKGAPVWCIGLTILVPGLITYLSLFTGPRIARLSLLPLALWGMWVMVWSYKYERRKWRDVTQLIIADDVQLFELSVRLSWVIGMTSWWSDALRQPYLFLMMRRGADVADSVRCNSL